MGEHRDSSPETDGPQIVREIMCEANDEFPERWLREASGEKVEAAARNDFAHGGSDKNGGT